MHSYCLVFVLSRRKVLNPLTTAVPGQAVHASVQATAAMQRHDLHIMKSAMILGTAGKLNNHLYQQPMISGPPAKLQLCVLHQMALPMWAYGPQAGTLTGRHEAARNSTSSNSSSIASCMSEGAVAAATQTMDSNGTAAAGPGSQQRYNSIAQVLPQAAPNTLMMQQMSLHSWSSWMDIMVAL